ncbi:MAG: translation initiation factor IF-2, partial [Clostridiales bacterium]|nr:translation initiation factor IF-2 [Clostridiales bacterium]
MSKKVSELTKELDITLQELKDYAAKMGIEIKSASSAINDVDAGRLESTINMMRGNAGSSKAASRPRPMGRPVIPRKPVVPAKSAQNEEAHAAETEAAEAGEAPVAEVAEEKTAEVNTAAEAPAVQEEADQKQEEVVSEADKPAEVNTPAEDTVAAEEPAASVEEKPAETSEEHAAAPEAEEKAPEKEAAAPEVKSEEAASEKKAEPAQEEEEYVNAPNKPMRFKKISDAATEKKKAEELRRRQQERWGKTSDSKDQKGGKDGRKQSRSKDDRKDGKDSKENRNNRNKSASGEETRRSPKGSGQRDAAPASASAGSGKASKGKSKKFFDNKDRDKQSRFDRREDGPGGRRNNNNNNIYDERALEKQERHKKKYKTKTVEEPTVEELLPEGTIAVTAPITVAGLSEQAEISVSKIIMSMMQMGVMATINQSLDKDAIEMLAEDLGLNIVVTEEEPEIEEPGIDTHEDSENELQPRPPIITVMGHVDHGKTSLLDAIRNTNVTAGESGGITQHIGASEVEINGKKIVFLDTPGHEAFTTMRARGAQVTDIAVLVVAADDGVMPQTVESISHAKAAGVPIIVAINKMDKPGANPDRVKQELTEHGILVEDWGGDVISVPVSAKKGEGITDLLEMILLQAEVLELKANPDRLALGTVIEARLDKTKGPVATLLVSNGTLKSGQSVVAGTTSGKIRVMTDFKGKPIRKAGPATAVEILGLSDVPAAGDAFNVVRDDKTAREIAANRKEKMRGST